MRSKQRSGGTEQVDKFILVLMMAVTVEGLVEYGRTLWEGAAAREFQAVALQAAALALSVALCFAAGADFYRALGVNFSAPWIGTVLTGIFASRGANYLSDLLGKLQGVGKVHD